MTLQANKIEQTLLNAKKKNARNISETQMLQIKITTSFKNKIY